MRNILVLTAFLAMVGTEKTSAKIRFYSSGGIGLAFSTAKQGEMSYRPFVAPHIATRMPIVISKRVSLETGIGYTIKGFNNKYTAHNGMEKFELKAKSRFHYLSVPVIANYRFYKSPNSVIWVGAGMNYGFFLAGSERTKVSTYVNDELTYAGSDKVPVYGVISGARVLPNRSGKNVEALDVMFRAQVNYLWKDKYVIGIFHDHSLYDIDSKRLSDAISVVKLRYTGLTVGYYWR